MASNIDLLVDSSGTGLIAGGSAPGKALPILTRNDTYNFRIRVMQAPQGQVPSDIDLSGSNLKLGIGTVDAEPTSGNFKLSLAGPVTSGSIPYNATTAQFLNAVSGIAGNITVATYGSSGSAWLVTAATLNTALSFSGIPFTLFPTSSVLVNTRRNPDADSFAQQIIELKRSPAIYADSFTSASTAGVISLSKTQDGDAATNKNETYKLTVGPDAVGGSFTISYGTNTATAVALGSDAGTVQAAIASVTGIGSGNLSVAGLSNGQGYSLTFVNALGSQNITTALTIDTSGVYFAPYKSATVTMGTAELDALFVEEDANSIETTLEIELTSNGNPKTLFQGPITVRKDLIAQGAAVPSPQASYYTKAEVDSGFVAISSGNVDSTNRILNDSSSDDSINWQTRKLLDGTTEYVRWDNGLGFYGNSAVTQPNGTNAINNVISTGLIANSSTYGVLPGSIKTLTTTASVWFGGAIAANDTHSISVGLTGASLNDVVLFGLPSGVCQGLTFQGCVVSTNVVSIIAQNGTNNSQNQATATYRITVIGY